MFTNSFFCEIICFYNKLGEPQTCLWFFKNYFSLILYQILQLQEDEAVKLEDIKLSLEDLKENVVTKKDFEDFMVKFNSLYDMVKTALPDNSSQSSFSPSVPLQEKLLANSLASAQVC